MKRLAGTFFLWLPVLGAAAWGEPPVPRGGEFQVNTYTTSYQHSPAVAADSRGNLVVVWQSALQKGEDGFSGIFGQRYDSRGRPRGSEFQINTFTAFQQNSPEVAANSAGNFVVAWTSTPQDGSDSGVFGQRFNPAGVPRGGEFQINSYTTQSQCCPEVGIDSAGNFVIVWTSYLQDGSKNGVFGQRFDAGGVRQGGEFQINTYTTDFQTADGIAVDSAGNFVVVWQGELQDGSSSGVFARRFDAAGVAKDLVEFQVNTYTTSYQFHPTIAGDSAGNFIVVWASTLQDGSLASLWGQRYDSGGIAQGGEFQVNSYTGYQVSPRASIDAAGNFVVAWQDFEQDGSSYGIFGRQFDSLGTPLGPEFQVSSYTTDYQDSPAVAAHGSGSFVVVWESYLQDGSYDGVFGQQFEIPVFVGGMESGDFSGWSSVFPPPGP